TRACLWIFDAYALKIHVQIPDSSLSQQFYSGLELEAWDFSGAWSLGFGAPLGASFPFLLASCAFRYVSGGACSHAEYQMSPSNWLDFINCPSRNARPCIPNSPSPESFPSWSN